MNSGVWMAAVFAFLIQAQAWAGDGPASARALQVVVTEDFPPFYYREKGAYKGASFDIVSLLCARLGFHLHINVAPMRRVLAGLESGRYHLSPNLTETPGRSQVALFTQVPFVYESQDLILRADSDIRYDGNLRALQGYRFGAMAGWAHGPNFDHADYLRKEYRTTLDAQLRSLLAGRFDIAVNNRQFFLHYAAQVGLQDQVRVLEPSTYRLPVTAAVSRALPDAQQMVIALDRELMKLKQEPVYLEILERYGFSPEPSQGWHAMEPHPQIPERH